MLIIFDWDGTLSDSADKITLCMQQAADALGLPVLADDKIKNIIGLGLPEAIATLYPEIDQGDIGAMRDEYARHFVSSDEIPSPLFPYVANTLERLKTEGHTLAVATGKSRKGLNRVFGKSEVSSLFDASRCADETASKPHPKMLYELLSEFRAPVDRAVMVGDTEYDMEMAVRANMTRVAVTYGAHDVSRLRNFEPALCVDRLDQMLDWIEGGLNKST